jgi:ADP-glucose pyrophosphorylase
MFGFKKKLDFGFIIGQHYDQFLSFDDYADHLLLPYSPRFRNVDFAVSSLVSAGIRNIMVVVTRDKDIVLNYLVKGWPLLNFWVWEPADAAAHLEEFFEEYAKEHSLELISVIQGSFPVWLNMRAFQEDLEKHNSLAVRTKFPEGELTSCIVVERKLFQKKIMKMLFPDGKQETDLGRIAEENGIKYIEEKGYLSPFRNLREFYEIHLSMIDDYLLLDKINSQVPIRGDLAPTVTSLLAPHSNFKNSLFGEGVDIDGTIENSVIFSNVRIDKGAVVKNSVIFPGNHIGHDAVITNAIIDEFTREVVVPNIEPHAVIGSGTATESNRDFPAQLDFGITLVGKEIVIPASMRVGANCYIESFTDPLDMKNFKILPDGYSIRRRREP